MAFYGVTCLNWDYNRNIFFIFLVVFFISFSVTFSSYKQSSKILTANLEEFEGLEIDSVVIDNHNIYDVNDKEYDNIIFKTANKLHYKTRKHIILKELLFKAGDSLSCELIEESERNLRNRLALFNAWIEVEKMENDHLLIKVITIDQWSIAGGLDFERDGNETEYRLWGEEKNFLVETSLSLLNDIL